MRVFYSESREVDMWPLSCDKWSFIFMVQKCDCGNVYLNGLMLQEEAMFINGWLDNDNLTTFTTFNGWLEKFKIDFGLLE